MKNYLKFAFVFVICGCLLINVGCMDKDNRQQLDNNTTSSLEDETTGNLLESNNSENSNLDFENIDGLALTENEVATYKLLKNISGTINSKTDLITVINEVDKFNKESLWRIVAFYEDNQYISSEELLTLEGLLEGDKQYLVYTTEDNDGRVVALDISTVE